jgi:anti-sigma factor RsiW
MIERLERLTLRWGHARPRTLSRYIEGELTQSERVALEAHLSDCPGCQALLQSLTSTLQALRSMRSGARPDLADSVIAGLRAKSSSQDLEPGLYLRHPGAPALTVVPDVRLHGIERATAGPEAGPAWRRIARALVGYRLRRPHLRLTLPLTLLAGAALSLINQGSMIFGGRANLFEVCLQCSPNFVIPFVALNIGLFLAARLAGRSRP